MICKMGDEKQGTPEYGEPAPPTPPAEKPVEQPEEAAVCV